MASHSHLDDEDDFGGDYPGSHSTKRSGNKRNFGDLDEDEDDLFGSKKGNSKLEETAPGVATGMILSLRESLQNCKDTLATCQTELEVAKLEIQKWHAAFQNESFITAGTSPEPGLVVSYLQTLKFSDESLKEQLEKAKKKEAAFIVTFAKREQEIAELKSAVRDLKVQLKPPSMQARRLLLDPAIHEEFTRLKNLVEEKEKKVKELQDNVAAVNFTPQSKMGKMLMAKCRTLQEENEEIGTLASEGKIHELAMKLALQKSQNAVLRSQFEALRVRSWTDIFQNLAALSAHHLECLKEFQSHCTDKMWNLRVKDELISFKFQPSFYLSSFTLSMGLYKHMEGLENDVDKSNEMVLLLQGRLAEKDSELKLLRNELYQKEHMEEENIDSADGKKVTDEVNSDEARN